MPTEEMQTEIQKVIPEFLKVYVPFNAKDDFLKNSKPYLTENLYKALEQEQRRGTLTIVKTKMTNVELEPQKEGIHVARAIDYRGIERGKDCEFSNTLTGLEELLQWMKELQQEHAKSDVLFGTRACRMRVVT